MVLCLLFSAQKNNIDIDLWLLIKCMEFIHDQFLKELNFQAQNL